MNSNLQARYAITLFYVTLTTDGCCASDLLATSGRTRALVRSAISADVLTILSL